MKKLIKAAGLAAAATLAFAACTPAATVSDTGYPELGVTSAYEHRNELLAQLNGGADVLDELAELCSDLGNYSGIYYDAEWLQACKDPHNTWDSYTGTWVYSD